MLKRIITVTCIIALIVSLSSVVSLSAASQTIKVDFEKVTITVDGVKSTTPTFSYKDTTYVPLRAISEMVGCIVDYDAATETAKITKDEASSALIVVKPANGNTKNISADLDKIKVTVNGKKISTPTIIYSGTTYVPLRAISEMLGCSVDYDDSEWLANQSNNNDKNQNDSTKSSYDSTTVYVSDSSSTVHTKSNCSGMKYFSTMTWGEAKSRGITKCCQKCATHLN
ncbi:MAG: copper amine oxidase N-terminal domain-containing protein [Clostridiales bacterium]|jgi:hypothetical protein|nr:copper amine oxidase N-terminal domain-containing protein [Clostridiales bacterium]